jgi:very-short-patch-repair endonuclease
MTVEKFLYSYNTVIARKLRKEQTKGEKVLWERLRSRKIRGQKFKRQHSIGSFITDFYCYAKRLVVEVDGSIHDEINQNEF